MRVTNYDEIAASYDRRYADEDYGGSVLLRVGLGVLVLGAVVVAGIMTARRQQG